MLLLFVGRVAIAQELKLPGTAEEISTRCAGEEKLHCEGDCVDGFGTTCYYDASEHAAPPQFFNEPAKCFGYRHQSVCNPCANVFQIRSQGAMKDVSCGDFYKRLQEKNAACKNCLRTTMALGG